MHEVVAKTILSNNKLDIYRGCTCNCVYCESRNKCYKVHQDFLDVEVRTNAPNLLDDALRKKKVKTMIGIGIQSDPYMDIEADYKLTRKCLEVILKHGFGVTIYTKSDLVLRDLDLLKEINKNTKAVVVMSYCCSSDSEALKFEPNVCPTSKRIEALKKLDDEGIATVACLAPFMPYINDSEENFKKLIEMTSTVNVEGILYNGCGVNIRDALKDHYYMFLDANYPFLKRKYQITYKNSFVAENFGMGKLYQLLLEDYSNKHPNCLMQVQDITYFCENFESHNEQLSIFDELDKNEE